MPLTDAERLIVQTAFYRGPDALREAMDVNAIGAFLMRKDVRDYADQLELEYSNQEALSSRTRFVARRGLQRLAPQAVQIVADALQPPAVEFRFTKSGAIQIDVMTGRPLLRFITPPDYQRQMALAVLDRLGVGPDKENQAPQVNLNMLLNKAVADSVEIDYGSDALKEDQKALSRERMRNAIMTLTRTALPKAHAMLATAMGDGKKKPKKKKVKSKEVAS